MKVSLYYKQQRSVSIWLHCCYSELEGWYPINQFDNTIWLAVVTPTDRPKSVRNRCVIEVFGGVFVLLSCSSDYSVGGGALIIRLSQISSFFSFGTCD